MRIWLEETEVIARLGIARSTLRVWIAEGNFPAPCRLASRTIRWRASDILDWEASRQPAIAPLLPNTMEIMA